MTNYLLHPLDGCFERVQRADQHLTDFKRRVETMLMKQAYAVGVKLDPNPPHYVKITLPPETFFDIRFGVLIGEICYNLRCALDYLIFELAKLDSGIEQDGTQFPIEDTKKGFEGRAKGSWLKGINAAHIAAIERLQPYYGCNWTKRLRECSNRDKHRHLVQAGGNATFHAHSSLEKDLGRCLGYERETRHPVIGQPPVKVKIYPTGGITFRDGAPVAETVEEIKTQIAHTLDAIKPDF